ncbi:Zn-dependent alcohol dehydrogenase [Pseudonocardia nematodicida]|uniref:Zn-dependent alcohol dehydrogenase n=1 Tax=Pseudonocardia nematodicida TaxID=1206997 RepID=A0ABV1K4Y2_9PSEU
MRAALLTRFDAPLQVAEVSVADPDPDEVLVRTVASGICHSDKHAHSGAQPLGLPMVLGHEASGIVERVGSAVTYVRPGDRVVTAPAGFCGTCTWCLTGALHHCADNGRTRAAGRPPRLSLDGEPVSPFVGLGGFGEQMLVHQSALCRIPEEMPMDRAALLGCAVITGFGAVLHTAAVRPGQDVAVIGCGGVGLNVVQAARFAGARRVVAVDRLPAKLDRARDFGASHVVDASSTDAVEAIRELTGGGVDHAFEVVGAPATIEQAFAALRPRGTATMVGVPRPDARVTIPPVELLGEKKLQGSRLGSSRFRVDVELYCHLYLEGRMRLDDLLSSRIGLDGVSDALLGMDSSEGARTMIEFPA